MKPFNKLALAFSIAALAAGCSDDNSGSDDLALLPEPQQQVLGLSQAQRDSSWFVSGEQAVDRARDQVIDNTPARPRTSSCLSATAWVSPPSPPHASWPASSRA
ncbi:hypothetical protein [Microbulbifer taiwanensis]|uniref:hypothetical protein n=1 Tax=Microbulbifer taiwanensis TaxID=986746 RepID=UPI00360604BF